MKTIILLFIPIIACIDVYGGNRVENILVEATETNPNGGGYNKARLYLDLVSYDIPYKITKPLIVFEGYDPGIYTKPKEIEGRTGIENFLQDVNYAGETELKKLLQGTQAQPSLQEYDIIYVNWVNGTDYLENNEKVAKAVINWVNQKKTEASSTEPNVIIGRSMGAVIARMALKHMENEHAANSSKPLHNTRLFISNDGGMQGSNIPQGYQHLANHFRDLYISTGAIGHTIENWPGFANLISSPLAKLSVNETPASRELAINHVNTSDDIDNSLHNSFLASLNTLDYPSGDNDVSFKMIAVSNGSECAKAQDIGSGGTILEYDGDISTTGLTSLLANIGFGLATGLTGGAALQAFSFPPLMVMGTVPGPDQFNLELKVNGKADNQTNEVYKGKISYVKKVLGFIPVIVLVTNRSKTANPSALAYDYFPGGNQDLATEDLPLPQPGSNEWIEKNVVFNHKPYCHVPVPSALDIGEGNATLTYEDYFRPYHGATPPTGTKSSPFTDGFLTAFNATTGSPDNEPHTQINRRNGDWMAQWLQGSQPTSQTCAFLCSGPSISGENAVCSTSTNYTIPNLPTDATVSWLATPSGIVTITCIGTGCQQAEVTRVSSGSITLSATVTSSCTITPVVINKPDIIVGPPEGVGIVSYSNLGLCENGFYQVQPSDPPGFYYYSGSMSVTPSPGVGTITWTLAPGTSSSGWVWSSSGNTATFNSQGTFTALKLRATASNACGSVYKDYTFITGTCIEESLTGGGGEEASSLYSISPNPTSSIFSATLKESSNTKAYIKEIVIQNKFGFEVKRIKYSNSSKTQQVNLSGLSADIYIVRIYDGKSWTATKVAKE